MPSGLAIKTLQLLSYCRKYNRILLLFLLIVSGPTDFTDVCISNLFKYIYFLREIYAEKYQSGNPPLCHKLGLNI